VISAIERNLILYKILHEDKHLLVIDKLSTVPCIRLGDSSGLSDELILEYPGLVKIPDYGFTHRLDNETLGAVIVAKDLETYEKIRLDFDSSRISKTYHARVSGVVEADEGCVELPIAHSLKSAKKMLVVRDGYRVYRGQPRQACTKWKVLSRSSGTTDLALSTNTGVRHQIRVHLLSIGHPICGDRLYNKDFLSHPSLMLICKRIEFTHPRSEEKMAINSELELNNMFKEFY